VQPVVPFFLRSWLCLIVWFFQVPLIGDLVCFVLSSWGRWGSGIRLMEQFNLHYILCYEGHYERARLI